MNETGLVEAIEDLIRVTVAFNNLEGSKAEAIRRMLAAGIKQARIAKLLNVSNEHVSSVANKLRKAEEKQKKEKKNGKG